MENNLYKLAMQVDCSNITISKLWGTHKTSPSVIELEIEDVGDGMVTFRGNFKKYNSTFSYMWRSLSMKPTLTW